MKKVIYTVAILLFLAVFLYAGWNLLQIAKEYRKGEKEYENLAQYVVIPEDTAPSSKATEKTQTTEPSQSTEPESGIVWPVVDFAALQAINPDVVGWIYIEGTKVNYPVVQGVNDDQYLYRLISGEYNSAGSIFLDAQASALFQSRNNAIYGHNMKNGTMFADIVDYKSQKFYDAHPVALLMTPEKNYIVHLFSGYTTDAWGDAWQISFTDEEYAAWLDKISRRSYFASDVVPTISDCLLTFSTCTYETQEGRFVLHGVLEAQ